MKKDPDLIPKDAFSHRRDFLRSAVGAAAALGVRSGPILGANDRIGIGFIGAGRRAKAPCTQGMTRFVRGRPPGG